jgi:cytochrome P450
VFTEFRGMIGDRLFNLPHEPSLSRKRTLQPVFTKERIGLSAGHMTETAEPVWCAWRDGATINLDTECRTLTSRALGRSLLGADLTNRDVAEPLQVAITYVVDRAVRPVRATPGYRHPHVRAGVP